jgi:hemin uptake protein HemP
MSFDTDNRDPSSANATASSTPVGACTPRRLFSEELIGPTREVLIRHAGFDYRLRITRQGKLILTK